MGKLQAASTNLSAAPSIKPTLVRMEPLLIRRQYEAKMYSVKQVKSLPAALALLKQLCGQASVPDLQHENAESATTTHTATGVAGLVGVGAKIPVLDITT